MTHETIKILFGTLSGVSITSIIALITLKYKLRKERASAQGLEIDNNIKNNQFWKDMMTELKGLQKEESRVFNQEIEYLKRKSEALEGKYNKLLIRINNYEREKEQYISLIAEAYSCPFNTCENPCVIIKKKTFMQNGEENDKQGKD